MKWNQNKTLLKYKLVNMLFMKNDRQKEIWKIIQDSYNFEVFIIFNNKLYSVYSV